MTDPRDRVVQAARDAVTAIDARGMYSLSHQELRKALEALDALPADTSGDGWRHKKRGTTYDIIGNGRVQCAEAVHDMAEVVIYRADVDGSLWVRPWQEFYDGRFERIQPAPPTPKPEGE